MFEELLLELIIPLFVGSNIISKTFTHIVVVDNVIEFFPFFRLKFLLESLVDSNQFLSLLYFTLFFVCQNLLVVLLAGLGTLFECGVQALDETGPVESDLL